MSMQARGRAGFESAQFEAEFPQALGETVGSGTSAATARDHLITYMYAPPKRGAGGDDHGASADIADSGYRYPGHAPAAAIGNECAGVALDPGEVGLGGDALLHAGGVGGLIALDAGGLHGGSTTAVEDAEMDAGGVGVERHLTAQGVELADKVRLGEGADGGVAGHGGDIGEAVGHQQGLAAEARGGQRRLAAGVTATDHDDVPDAAGWIAGRCLSTRLLVSVHNL
jgi:hypothetical protein